MSSPLSFFFSTFDIFVLYYVLRFIFSYFYFALFCISIIFLREFNVLFFYIIVVFFFLFHLFPLFYLSFSSLLYLLAAFNSIASFMLPSFPEPVINPGTESSSSHHTANNLSDTPTTTYFIHKYSATLFRSCWRHLQKGGSTNDVTGSCRL